MDPKSLSNIDPKLRETYERVMGTTTAGSSPTPAAASPISVTTSLTTPPAGSTPEAEKPSDIDSPIAAPASPQPTVSPAPEAAFVPAAEPTLSPPTPSLTVTSSTTSPVGLQQTVKYNPLPSPSSVQQTDSKSSPLLRTLYLIGGVVFFLIYTIFWIKVFNLPFFF